MARRIIRGARARQDVVEAFLYIAEESPTSSVEAGERFLGAVRGSLELLSKSPEMGRRYESTRPGLEGFRWFPVKGFGKHLIFYVPIADGIRFVRLLHGMRDIARELEEFEVKWNST